MGTLGLFFTCFLLFIRWIPMIAVAEVKGVLPAADPHFGHSHAHDEDLHSEPAGAVPVPGE
jgi:molybdopterin-containing oxidoreductase family membrane subunit